MGLQKCWSSSFAKMFVSSHDFKFLSPTFGAHSTVDDWSQKRILNGPLTVINSYKDFSVSSTAKFNLIFCLAFQFMDAHVQLIIYIFSSVTIVVNWNWISSKKVAWLIGLWSNDWAANLPPLPFRSPRPYFPIICLNRVLSGHTSTFWSESEKVTFYEAVEWTLEACPQFGNKFILGNGRRLR